MRALIKKFFQKCSHPVVKNMVSHIKETKCDCCNKTLYLKEDTEVVITEVEEKRQERMKVVK